MKRRTFLKQSTLASSALFVPSFVQAAQQVFIPKLGLKRLVIVQLSGGNDGLNTIIPIHNDLYYKARPSISVSKNEALRITDSIGFHKALLPLQRLYDQGQLCIINNVGYPNPNRSHFRSTDIWQTASDADQYLKSGWVGRYLDAFGKHAYNAIELDDSLSLAMKGEALNAIATKHPEMLFKTSNDPFFNSIIRGHKDAHLSDHNLGYLYKTLVDAKSSAKYIHEKHKINKTKGDYPNHEFAKQLKTTANLIHSNIDTKIFYTSLSGFDTHANQPNQQENLLKTYATSIQAFINDLKANGSFDDTLILTFSEFGRRVKENAGRGTDHGAANNVFLMGSQLKKQGFYNELASLQDLDANGDIKFEIDFRRIYATILNKWLAVDDKKVLNKTFEPLNFI